MTNFDVPGRGAWTLKGGLLPLKPGSKNRAGYYRATGLGEVMVGRLFESGADTSYSAQVVFEAVKVIQRLVGVQADGLLGNVTAAAIVTSQTKYHLTADGIAGPATLKALLTPIIQQTATKYAIPIDVIGGVCVWESRLDPGAIGVSGADAGIAQINRLSGAAVNFSLEQCLDPAFALDFTGHSMAAVYARWNGHTTADPWDIAVANHNSPKSAQEWAETGKPPYSKSRHDQGFPQIAEYVQKARSAWTE